MRYVPILLIFFLFNRCSWVGSRGILIAHPTKPIHRVALIIVQDIAFNDEEAEMERLVFSKTLGEELSRRRLFPFTILSRRYSTESMNFLEESLLGTELMNTYDAYMLCTPKGRGMDYRVSFKLYESNPTQLLISARHNTTIGNSYWWYQSRVGILQDATREAVATLEQKWRKLQ